MRGDQARRCQAENPLIDLSRFARPALISILGAIHPRTKVQGVLDEKHGFIWCFGASLFRLLPVIEINEDFKKFFNNPNRAMLTNLRSFIFSAMGIVGWIPGAILIAAVSGLTQSS